MSASSCSSETYKKAGIIHQNGLLMVGGGAETAQGSQILADRLVERSRFDALLGPDAELVLTGQGEGASCQRTNQTMNLRHRVHCFFTRRFIIESSGESDRCRPL